MKDLSDFKEGWINFGGYFSGQDMDYVMLDGNIYGMKEDPLDGYRSYLLDQGIVERPDGAIFSLEKNPVKLWAVSDAGDFEGLFLYTEEGGELIGEFGTANTSDYYPSCRINFDANALTEYLATKA